MKVDLFDFELPPERIAQAPAEPRDAARLLHVPAEGPFGDLGVRDLPAMLDPGDLLVFNDTRVIPARLRATRRQRLHGGGQVAHVELMLHKRVDGATWLAFARPAKKLLKGDPVRVAEDFSGQVIDKREGGEVMIAFDRADADLDRAIQDHGEMPLPPYIRRDRGADPEAAAFDRARYQTVYAKHDGAVAAPTAGLHVTSELMAALQARRVRHVFVTLHVGAGTFLPVKADDTDDHAMHSEWGEVSPATAGAINQARAEGRKIVPVGTTSLRLIESAAGEDGSVRPFSDDTDIFIAPGYRFRVADRLMTNFHLPRSTLFMLVAAFSGLNRMKNAYRHAIANGYRFYSYGDACLLERRDP